MAEKTASEVIERAVHGDKDALSQILLGVQDMVFNLSLRMLGTVQDAQDAAQEILVRIMTNLGTFRFESEFNTWVYRISSNYLLSYKESMFSQYPLSFDYYGEDILRQNSPNDDSHSLTENAELAEELKQTCSNVMLQCFSPEDRCIFVFGTIFHLDSRAAADSLNITAENYRQRLSRLRRKMRVFLENHCGLEGSSNCSCASRVSYALARGRITRDHLPFTELSVASQAAVHDLTEGMNRLDDAASLFDDLPTYKSPFDSQRIIEDLLGADALSFLEDERNPA